MKMIEKTDGNGNTIMVENPDSLFIEHGGQKKVRRKPTNFTPPKKKRKHRK